jgi:hypothetical protein
MDVTLFPDRKTVDDFVIHDANVLLVRSGVSRFRLRAESRTEAIHIEISSSRALTVDCDEPVPTWASIQRAAHDAFAVVRVRNVTAHLEQMDRGLYWLGVGRRWHDGRQALSTEWTSGEPVTTWADERSWK